MKKLFFISVLFICFLGGNAQTFIEFPTDEEMQATGGVQAFSISRNGRYVVGATYKGGGCVFDVQEKKLYQTYASAVADDGTVVAGRAKYNLHTGETSALNSPGKGYSFVMTTGISADGKIVTGIAGPDWTALSPVYWENEEVHFLPFPSTQEVGTFKVNGCRAEGVSDDGSVIWGYFIANPNTNNLIIWERQPDGSYDYAGHKNVWEDLYEPQHGYIYDYDKKVDEFVCGPNPYCLFQPYAMSGDGRLVLIRTQENTDEVSPPVKIGIYHVDTHEFETAPWSADDVVGQARDFDSRGIANDGTVVGIAFEINLSSAVPFIMNPGEGPRYLNDVYPQFDRLFYYEDNSINGLPYLLTSISEDARYITGYSTDIITYTNEFGEEGRDFGFRGYVIDRKADTPDNPEENAVESIHEDTYDADARYYTLEGLEVKNCGRGVYIRRTPDGRSSKIIIP